MIVEEIPSSHAERSDGPQRNRRHVARQAGRKLGRNSDFSVTKVEEERDVSC